MLTVTQLFQSLLHATKASCSFKPEALVGYWKLNEGSGANVKDSSTSGADMLGQHDVRTYSNYISTGTSDLNYVKVDLP